MIKVIDPSYSADLEKKAFDNLKLHDKFKVFLAGTIDNGESDNWQGELIWQMKYRHHGPNPDADESIGDIVVFNPRRSDWKSDATVEDVENQIKWEQEHLDNADLIIMYLADGSKSPISLLELGLYGKKGNVIVFCTDKFYKFTNVRLTCEKYMIPLIQTTDSKKICDKIETIYRECAK